MQASTSEHSSTVSIVRTAGGGSSFMGSDVDADASCIPGSGGGSDSGKGSVGRGAAEAESITGTTAKSGESGSNVAALEDVAMGVASRSVTVVAALSMPNEPNPPK